jgi:hypothetical protein
MRSTQYSGCGSSATASPGRRPRRWARMAVPRRDVGDFQSVRDLHTNYLLPEPYSGKIAYLPFLVEEYHDEQGGHHYIISHIGQGYSAPGYCPTH